MDSSARANAADSQNAEPGSFDPDNDTSQTETIPLEHVPRQSLSAGLPFEASQNAVASHPTGLKFVTIIAATTLLFVLVGLDSNIVATAVPAMTRYFGTISDIGWYTSVYRLTAASFQFMFGKIYSLANAKPVILATLIVFAAGNLLCALAPTSPIFILGRAVAGLATAGVISGAFAMLMQTTTLQQRSTYAGIGGATEAFAGLIAPMLGGVLVDSLTWKWCFYIQLPMTGIAFFVILLSFDGKRPQPAISEKFMDRIRSLDLLGTALFVPALSCLLLGLQWGGTRYGWSNWRILTAIGVFLVLIGTFSYWQYRQQDRATLPPRIILQRSVLSGFCFSCCNNASLAIVEYYIPTYFQVVKGMSAARSGIMMLPCAAGLILSVSLSGVLTSRFGYYNPFMISTSLITPVATGLISALTKRSPLATVLSYLGMLGLGTGIGFQGPQVAIQTIFSQSDSQIGLAIIQFAQGIGPAVFVAVAQSIFQKQLAVYILQDAPHADLAALAEQGLHVPRGHGSIGIVQSYAKALGDALYTPVGLSCATLIGSITIEWRSVKEKKP